MSYLVLARQVGAPRSFRRTGRARTHVRRALHQWRSTRGPHPPRPSCSPGPRAAVGKTTIARIFAKSPQLRAWRIVEAVRGVRRAQRTSTPGRFVDLLEVDAASRTKVDDTRELLDKRAVRAGAWPRQGVPHRRSAHALHALVQCAAQDARGAAPPSSSCRHPPTRRSSRSRVAARAACSSTCGGSRSARSRSALRSIAKAENVEFEAAALRALRAAPKAGMRGCPVAARPGTRLPAAAARWESEVRALLGTLDRRHVEAILNALAARRRGGPDGLRGAARRTSRRITTRRSASSGAIQRMALLQAAARPARRGDEEQDTFRRLRRSSGAGRPQLL